TWPHPDSPLRIERFSMQVQEQYHDRYDGMPPHDKPSKDQKEAMEALGDVVPEPDEDGDDDRNAGD
ncbi:MAG: hypothetical protein ACNA8P_09875, partial [Phycisphaerales bacterium]